MARAADTRLPVRLTELSHGAGCACKIGARELAPIVASLPASPDGDVLVDAGASDDAGVFRVSEELALVQSVDFFTPIVDDPYDFGRIAAANALSDIYAMGARPLTALNLVAFSLERLGHDVLREILRGGADVTAAAGVAVIGGHSIDDAEPKYGMSVTGVAHPERIVRNSSGRAGDVLFLTKPVGGGAIATAAKHGLADEATVARCTEVMTTLNAAAADVALEAGVTAMTDVSGFGLAGHLHELALGSGLAARIEAAAVPAIEGALELLRAGGGVSGGSARNRDHAETFTAFGETVAQERRALICDAMTSGGLLIATAQSSATEMEQRLAQVAPGSARIGELQAGDPGRIEVA